MATNPPSATAIGDRSMVLHADIPRDLAGLADAIKRLLMIQAISLEVTAMGLRGVGHRWAEDGRSRRAHPAA